MHTITMFMKYIYIYIQQIKMVSCISSFQSICFEEDVEIPNCVQLAILPPDASCEG